MVLSLCASEVAYSQTAADISSPPSVSASDAEHDAAIVRLVRSMGIYSVSRQMWGTMFGTPGQANDPVLDRFIDEVLPETWVCEAMAEVFKPALTGLSPKEIDDASHFFQSPAGKKYTQLVFGQLQNGKSVDFSSQKWTPAERAAITKFSNSPVGLASSKVMGGEAAKALGEKMGAQRMKDVLTAAQAKYAAMDDIDLQLEADRVHDGSSRASIIEQLAVIKESNDRNGRHQTEALSGIRPIMAHMGGLQPQDVLAQQSFAQIRNEMQKADDTFAQAAQAVQNMVTFTMESMSVLAAPKGLKKLWQSALEAKLGAANTTMANLTLTVHGVAVETDAMVDFLEAHKTSISIGKDGKLIFANKDDLATFQDLSTQLAAAREKLRSQASQTKSN